MSEEGSHFARGLLALDRLVHEPARLAILSVLDQADEVEFRFLETVTGLTRGNLSSHAAKLEDAGYLTVRKEFRERRPLTTFSITPAGRDALHRYQSRLRELMELAGNGRKEEEDG